MNKLKIEKKMFQIASLSLILATSLSGCCKKMECDVEYSHVHKYVNDDGFMTYRDSEYETEGNLFWTNNVEDITDDFKDLDRFNLLKIEDNIIALENSTKNDLDYMEYEYKHRYTTYSRVGKITVPISHTSKKFTTDSNHSNLTGRVRGVSYKYRAYRIVTNEDGDKEIESSDLVDDIMFINEDYPFFKLDDYKVKIYSDAYEKGIQKKK